MRLVVGCVRRLRTRPYFILTWFNVSKVLKYICDVLSLGSLIKVATKLFTSHTHNARATVNTLIDAIKLANDEKFTTGYLR
jgi:hypothetical protein